MHLFPYYDMMKFISEKHFNLIIDSVGEIQIRTVYNILDHPEFKFKVPKFYNKSETYSNT